MRPTYAPFLRLPIIAVLLLSLVSAAAQEASLTVEGVPQPQTAPDSTATLRVTVVPGPADAPNAVVAPEAAPNAAVPNAAVPNVVDPNAAVPNAVAPNAALPPEAAPIPEITGMTHCGDGCELYALSNGLKVLVKRIPGAPVTSVWAYVQKTGSQNEGRWLGTGISHYVEHLVCGGTTSTRGKEQTREIIDSLGGAMNAFTARAITSYYLNAPSGQAEVACDLIADWLQNCAFDPEEVESEKHVILQELLDGENDPGHAAMELLAQTLCREHPARHPIGGYPELMANLTRDDVMAFYKERYTPNNTLFCVMGDIDPQAIVQRIAADYRGSRRARELEINHAAEPTQTSARVASREMDTERCTLILAWPTVQLDDPDLFALDTLATILSGSEGARLNRKVKTGLGLSGSLAASSSTPVGSPGSFVIFADAAPNELETARKGVLDELTLLTQEPVTDTELLRAKKLTEAGFIFSKEAIEDQAQSAAMNLLFTGDVLFDKRYLEGIGAVTADDILRVAKKYFLPEKQNSVLILPKGSSAGQKADAAALADGKPQIYIPDNGLRLIIKRTEGLPKVNVQFFLLGGSLVENEGNAGIGTLLAEMLDKGSAHCSRTELEDFLASIGAELTFSSGRNALCAELNVLSDDFPEAMRYMTDAFFTPVFPEEELTLAKKDIIGRIERQSQQPIPELFQFFAESLPGTTPYHLPLLGTKESIEAITLDDLRAHHRRLLEPSNLIITVYGDIDAEKTASELAKYFAVLQKTNAEPISPDRHNETLVAIDRHKQTGKQVGTGIIAWAGTSVRDQVDYPALTVLTTILGGYGYPGGRLFTSLRHDGLIYRLTIDQIPGYAPGYIYALFESAPDKVTEIFDRISAEIERIKQGQLDASEVNAAKQRIIAFHPQQIETDAAQAHQAALDELYGIGFRNDEQFAERINSVTLESVVRVAKKYFNQPIRVSTSPNENR